MMTKQSSNTTVLLKKLAVIPLLTGFIFLLAERVEAQETIEIEEIVEVLKNSLDDYKIENKYYEADRIKKPHFIKSSKERQEQLIKSLSSLRLVYANLSIEDKKKAKKPIHPHNPYVKLNKNNKVFFKLRSALTEEDKLLIPPPPAGPNASKERILDSVRAYKD